MRNLCQFDIFRKPLSLILTIMTYKNWKEIILARWGRGIVIAKLRNGLKFKLRKMSSDYSILNDIFTLRKYDKYFPIKRDFIVIDIGAHIGIFSVYAAFKGAKVFSYEPEDENFKLLNENVRMNKLEDRVKAFKLGVYKKPGAKKMYLHPNLAGHSTFYSLVKSDLCKKVKFTTLRDIITANKIRFCDFLKINCEGSEYEIIMNLPNSTFRKIGYIALEYHKVEGYSYTDLLNLFQKIRFDVKASRPTKKGDGIIFARNPITLGAES